MSSTSAATPLSTTSPSHFDSMEGTSPDFLKMEDLDQQITSADSTSATPPPVIVQSKPAKKRKSWGQQLPEPKTTLPPRKRAKTEDEKEQRRIERIKRNRAAAHNSRERKRQEAEVLAVENAKLRTKLEAFEKHFGPLPKHIVLPEVTLGTDEAETPAPSLVESRGSVATAPSPASPSDLYDSTNNPEIKQEPHDSPFSPSYDSFDNLDGKQQMPNLAPLDETQHSAEMLCDLPCPSRRSRAHPSTTKPLSSTSPALLTTLTLLTILNNTFLSTYKTLLLAMMWTRSPSRPALRISRSARAWTSRSTTPSTSSSPPTASPRGLTRPSATALAQQYDAATAVAGTAALRGPLVGEGLRRRRVGSLATAEAGRAEEAKADIEAEGRSREQDDGVRSLDRVG